MRAAWLIVLLPFTVLGQTGKTMSGSDVAKLPAVWGVPVPTAGDTFTYFSLGDTALSVYKLPAAYHKPRKWVEAEKRRKEFPWGYYGQYGSSYSLKDALAALDTAREFHTVCVANSWCLDHPELVFPYLVIRLGEKKKVGLINTADLIIWDRNACGDLQFYGHGGSVDEDLFTIAGRASWILNEITGEDFAVVNADLSRTQAVNFMKYWAAYVQRLKIK